MILSSWVPATLQGRTVELVGSISWESLNTLILWLNFKFLWVEKETFEFLLYFLLLPNFEPAWAVAPTCWILAFSLTVPFFSFFWGDASFSKVRDWNLVIFHPEIYEKNKSWQFCESDFFFGWWVFCDPSSQRYLIKVTPWSPRAEEL